MMPQDADLPRTASPGERRDTAAPARSTHDSDRGRGASNEAQKQGYARSALAATVAQLHEFDDIIDVRSPGEFAEDHVIGAINCPVLDDRERAEVGTLYKQNAFEAKKRGAALVSANIARHLSGCLQDRPRGWRPLVYCWRGGGRSDALAHVLAQVGWRVARLDGGYKAYRRAVVADLETRPSAFSWRVLCGLTGTGKSRLLRALADAGAQVLDLEALAAHRGSVLGTMPEAPQPTQKMFDSLLWDALSRFDARRPVFVEGESRKIGRLRVADALIDAMWGSPCVVLDAPLAVRGALLMDEYAHYVADPESLCEKLACLTALHGARTVEAWQTMARERRWDAFVEALLVRHYDPAYNRSTLKHYPALAHAPHYTLADVSASAFDRLAQVVLEAATVRAA